MMNQLQSPCLATNDKVTLGVAEAVGGVALGARGAAVGAVSHMCFVGLPETRTKSFPSASYGVGWSLLKWATSGSMTLIMHRMEGRRKGRKGSGQRVGVGCLHCLH